MASTDPFEIVITGNGGHAAMPEKCTDTIYVANIIGTKIKEMARLKEEEDKKVVLGVTAINGGTNNNVIPDKVTLKGICRTYNNEIRKKVKKDLEQNVEKIAKDFRVDAKLKFVGNYPATINNKEEAEKVQEIAKNVAEGIDTKYKTMCSEDFSYFLEEKPGAMILVGCRKEEYYPQHNENFTCRNKSNINWDTNIL